MSIIIHGVSMEGFSIEKATFGGRFTQKEVKSALRNAGIRYSLVDDVGRPAHTVYQGHWAIFIEEKYSDTVSEWLWGELDSLPKVSQSKGVRMNHEPYMEKIMRRYDVNNDMQVNHIGTPVISWAEYDLAEAVLELLKKVSLLEKWNEELQKRVKELEDK